MKEGDTAVISMYNICCRNTEFDIELTYQTSGPRLNYIRPAKNYTYYIPIRERRQRGRTEDREETEREWREDGEETERMERGQRGDRKDGERTEKGQRGWRGDRGDRERTEK